MILGVIADDFTGAGDIANTLARQGMRTRMFVGPDRAFEGDCEAGVIALKTRSVAPDLAVRQSLSALESLLSAGCGQIVFKYCSTFDSTPAGNIGPVAEALAEALGERGVAVCPAFPATGRTVFQGHLFVGDRLLSESGMERHPLTPMTDPDIRRWLARQTSTAPGHVAHEVVRQGSAAIREALQTADARLVVVDAVSELDLQAIGEATAHARLITGGSGIAIGLPENFRRSGLIGGVAPAFQGSDAPALLFSGSCSDATRKQVRTYAANAPAIEVDVDRLIEGEGVLEEVETFMHRHAAEAPLIYSSADPSKVALAQARHGRETASQAVEAMFGELARRALTLGFGRIVVAGGETSGAVVTALGLVSFDLGPEIDPGVPALSAATSTGRRLALALKSGNFGGPDFLSKAVRSLGSADE